MEAAYSSSRTCYKVNVAETEKEEENNKIEKLLEKLLQQIDGLFRRRENDVSRKQSVEYYRCGRQRHLKRDCRARSPVPGRSTQQRPYRYLKGASTLGNGFTDDENKATSEVKIRSFTRGRGSTISGKIYENLAAITINTGAEVSIVRKGLVRAEDVEPTPETIRLKTATGESTPIIGEALV